MSTVDTQMSDVPTSAAPNHILSLKMDSSSSDSTSVSWIEKTINPGILHKVIWNPHTEGGLQLQGQHVSVVRHPVHRDVRNGKVAIDAFRLEQPLAQNAALRDEEYRHIVLRLRPAKRGGDVIGTAASLSACACLYLVRAQPVI